MPSPEVMKRIRRPTRSHKNIANNPPENEKQI